MDPKRLKIFPDFLLTNRITDDRQVAMEKSVKALFEQARDGWLGAGFDGWDVPGYALRGDNPNSPATRLGREWAINYADLAKLRRRDYRRPAS